MELRWLEVEASDAGQHSFAHRQPNTNLFLVLQFREREGPRGEEWWGPWRDVPIQWAPQE